MISHRAIGCATSSLWLFMACSPTNDGGGGDSADDVDHAPAGMTSPGGSTTTAPATSTPGSPVVPTPGSPSTNEGNAIPGGVARGNVPCDVASILSEHCTTCHGSQPQFNAPMSLTSAEAFGAIAPSSATQPVRQVASRRINADGAARMPPPGTVEALDAIELATLTAWLDGGAPSALEGGCTITDGPVLPDGEGELPAPTSPGTRLTPYEGWDADGVECFPFTAFQPGDKSTPFRVGTAVDTYVGFGFKPPWQGTRYVRALRTVVDNAAVLHHWILFEEPGAADGTAAEIIGAHPGGAMMHGWAPGGNDLYFTPALGMRMDSNSAFLLEVHYNSNDPGAEDASGVEICVTETVPPNEAIVSWLGTDAISGTSSSGTCVPRAQEPIHIVGGTPHMHLKGTHMKVVVDRAGGGQEVVHDEPFSFQNQRGYNQDLTIMPGDRITTTCSYNAPASFGSGTNDEMCYWFALAYPAGALTDGGLIGSLTHGANACLGF